MTSNIGHILEKLSLERLYKANIVSIWNVIKSKYLDNFQMLPYFEAIIDRGVLNIGGGKVTFKTRYNFDTDKRVFIKEHYIVFCINTDNITSTWPDSESAIKESFLDSLLSDSIDWLNRRLRVGYLRDRKPLLLDFIYSVFPEYKDPSYGKFEFFKVSKQFVKSSLGQSLWEEAFRDYFSKVMRTPIKREFHKMSWLDHNLLPMFIWDTESDLFYNMGTEYYNIKKLDRRTLNSKNFSKMTSYDFMNGNRYSLMKGDSGIGFPLYLDNEDLVLK